jgi:hypothetical protein
MEFTDPQEQAWYNSRPPVIQQLIARVPPRGTYFLKGDETGDYYTVYSYAENGTVSLVRYAGTAGRRSVFDKAGRDTWKEVKAGQPLWRVFGIVPDHLTPREEEAGA